MTAPGLWPGSYIDGGSQPEWLKEQALETAWTPGPEPPCTTRSHRLGCVHHAAFLMCSSTS